MLSIHDSHPFSATQTNTQTHIRHTLELDKTNGICGAYFSTIAFIHSAVSGLSAGGGDSRSQRNMNEENRMRIE